MPASFRTDRVRLVGFIKRKPGLSKEEFSDYWRNTHADVFMSLDIVKKNVLKYEQAHVNDKNLSKILAMSKGLLATPEWDGIGILEGESYEKLFAIFASEEYQNVVKPDEEKFIDRPSMQILPLDLVTVLNQ